MKNGSKLTVCTLTVLMSSSLLAQMPEFPGPAPEHAMLKQFVGEWESKGECSGGPDQPPMPNSGKISSRMLGDRWVISNLEINAGGHEVTGVQLIGYDPQKGKYVAVWADTMMNHLWQYEGEYDPAANTLHLYAEGPNFMTGEGTAEFRDSYEFLDSGEIVLTSTVKDDAGAWQVIMSGKSQRVDLR
ncbi:DUF1579 domain-containing protein [Botrimarina hoheduenensis]|uniref:DUF1579 domain-containing protein n=1 Tax=Botrimarina hoheduenensis TaxID=2528000 RepID=A0A5C5W8V1_9BACT|nr:DUF1579 domain-containing protein [Botrimarina hoheduenensis]TWT46693.1 hypothetical protein Pla111_17940 [Botrimarina hoheduenensis]